MVTNTTNKLDILYVFGGEKAQGAEIVIERLMFHNATNANTHLIISPGDFADHLLLQKKPYKITTLKNLKKLNRTTTGKLSYLIKAIANYFIISYKIYKYVKNNDINIVHANTIVPTSYLIPAVLIGKLFLKNVKWYWSDHDLRYFSKVETIISQICLQLYDNTLVVSNAVKDKYKGKFDDKICVLYNGLDIEKFKPDIKNRIDFRNNYDFDDNIILIGIAASINPDKGQLELLHVFNDLSAIFPFIRLIIAGSYATQFPEYAALVKNVISQNEKIVFSGYINDTVALYNGCDIIINNSNNSRSESLGTSIYEAMACEKLVVASSTGGTPEIITDNINGFLFEPDNALHLKETLIRVINRFKSLNYIRETARTTVIEKFNVVTMMKSYNHIIN